MKLLAMMLWCAMSLAADRQVAITFDDLPRSQDGGPHTLAAISALTVKLLSPFRNERLPVIGFVNEGNQGGIGKEGLREILSLWLDYGAELGNHSYSHFDINNTPLEKYTADILKGESMLRSVLAGRGRPLEYYRHPLLHTGATSQVKNGLQAFLHSHAYRVAPVTFDNSDYEFALLYTRPEYSDRVLREYVPYMESIVAFFEKRSVELVGREFPQVLLLHASQMNADMLPRLLAMLRRRGYRFVSLREALQDPAYKLADGYAGPKGLSWIHRWGLAKGMPVKLEPDAPNWVLDGIRR